MQIIPIYKYNRPDGGVTVSPIQPDVEYTEMVRLVADEGKVLTQDGVTFFGCTDTELTDGWYEVDAPDAPTDPDEATEQDYLNALNELGVQTDEENNA